MRFGLFCYVGAGVEEEVVAITTHMQNMAVNREFLLEIHCENDIQTSL